MSDTPLKDARNAGEKVVGYTDPDTLEHASRVPTQAEVDQEEAMLPILAGEAAKEATRELEDVDIAQAILDSDLGDLTYVQLEEVTLGQSSIIRKLGRVVWALLKERNRS